MAVLKGNIMNAHVILALVWLVCFVSQLKAEDAVRVLFDFDKPDASKKWQTVNDGVMGGRSEGRFTFNEDQAMVFWGKLSLQNNGGFASVRSKSLKMNLQEGDSLLLRVKGDGREYSLNLYVPRPRVAFSYRAMFGTRKEEWLEVKIPLSQFEATSFGRVVRNDPLVPKEVNGIGILLGDKQAGPFQLEVDWIKVIPSRD
jgi:NADH dehydrogenase [ubiquinone] 1 alpha subcomplex assembly factor 1